MITKQLIARTFHTRWREFHPNGRTYQNCIRLQERKWETSL